MSALNLPGAQAGPGDVDTLNLNIVGFNVYASVVQPDGKTVIAGQFSAVLGQARNNIAPPAAARPVSQGVEMQAMTSVQTVSRG